MGVTGQSQVVRKGWSITDQCNPLGTPASPALRALQRPATAYLLAIVAVAALTGLLVVMRDSAWPGLHSDAVAYAATPVNLALGRGPEAEVYSTFFLNNEPHGWTYRVHGHLWMAVVAALMPTADMPGLVWAVGTLNVISILAWALCFVMRCRAGGLGAWPTAAITVLGTAGLATILVWVQGRPDQLVPLILALTAMARLAGKGAWWRDTISGVEVGLLGATSPAAGLVAAGAWLVLQALAGERIGRFLVHAVVLGGLSVLSWYLTIRLIYPYDPIDLITNNMRLGHSERSFAPEMLVAFWVRCGRFPLICLPFAAAALLAMWVAIRRPLGAAQRGVVLLSLLFMAWAVVMAGVAYPPHLYRLIVFYPAVLLWVGLYLLGATAWPALPRLPRRALGAITLLGALAVPAGLVREALLLEWHLARGMPLDTARAIAGEQFQRLGPDERIGFLPFIVPSRVVFANPDWKLLSIAHSSELGPMERELGVKITVFIIPQMSADDPPPKWGDFVLQRDDWVRGRPTIFGLPLDYQMPGYQFAVYVRAK